MKLVLAEAWRLTTRVMAVSAVIMLVWLLVRDTHASPILHIPDPAPSVALPVSWMAVGPDKELHSYFPSPTAPSNGFDTCPGSVSTCRDGTPLSRAGCDAGTITYLCKGGTHPLVREELLTPSRAELIAAAAKNQPVPGPQRTAPHF